MIFVTLGTQDKSFKRLLEGIDKAINEGYIKEKVVVQAGLTDYKSKNMEILKLIPMEKFNDYIAQCSFLITHAGVGSIMTGITNHKKVVAIPRRAIYGEHTNDHQIEIASEFAKLGYIMMLDDPMNIASIIKDIKNFVPKEFKSNNSNFCNIISDFIDKS